MAVPAYLYKPCNRVVHTAFYCNVFFFFFFRVFIYSLTSHWPVWECEVWARRRSRWCRQRPPICMCPCCGIVSVVRVVCVRSRLCEFAVVRAQHCAWPTDLFAQDLPSTDFSLILVAERTQAARPRLCAS